MGEMRIQQTPNKNYCFRYISKHLNQITVLKTWNFELCDPIFSVLFEFSIGTPIIGEVWSALFIESKQSSTNHKYKISSRQTEIEFIFLVVQQR